jgi:hypothetical protein
MSYQQSNYDPNAYEQPGPPIKPYNWVQWTGVGLIAVGIAILLAYLAGRVGLIDPVINRIQPAFFLPFLGTMLINSRRAPSVPITTEQRERNRRVLVITLIVCATVIGGAALVEYTGA